MLIDVILFANTIVLQDLFDYLKTHESLEGKYYIVRDPLGITVLAEDEQRSFRDVGLTTNTSLIVVIVDTDVEAKVVSSSSSGSISNEHGKVIKQQSVSAMTSPMTTAQGPTTTTTTDSRYRGAAVAKDSHVMGMGSVPPTSYSREPIDLTLS